MALSSVPADSRDATAANAGATDLRVYLALAVDEAILTDDDLFAQAERDIVRDTSRGHAGRLPLFDESFYVLRRGSRLPPGRTPLEDYFLTGAALRLPPHPLVDVPYMLSLVEADAASPNPLLLALADDGALPPNPLFDAAMYLEAARRGSERLDLVPVRNPLRHYLANWRPLLETGSLRMSAYFDPYFFALTASRSEAATVDPLTDYFRRPAAERPDCNPKFHGGYYRATHATGGMDPLCHFILRGAASGLLPNPYAADELALSTAALPTDLVSRLLLDYIAQRSA